MSYRTDEYDDEYAELNLNEDSSSASFDSDRATPQYHIHQAEKALQNLKSVVKEPRWKKVLQHKSGTSVYSKLGITTGDKLPVFMSEHVFEGFTPRAIFAVIGMRKLWDDWYEEGNLVENLNDTTSLTYMVMQALAGSKARDLSLVEKIECVQNGTIYFAVTSVDSPKIPRVSNRIRAHLNLNGWILEPLSHNPTRTKVTYVLQTRIKGWVPSIVSKSYLARRPLVLHTIDQYLQKNGPLPMVISPTPPESARPSRAQSDSDTSSTYQDNSNNFEFTEVKYPRRKISITNLSETSAKQYDDAVPVLPIQATGEIQNGSLPHQDEPISSSLSSPMQPPSIGKSSSSILSRQRVSTKPIQHRHTSSVQRALEIFRSYIPLDGWDFYSESKNVKIYMKEIAGRSTPIMRGDSVIFGGFTTYDILSVIKCLDTRKLWDERYDEGATYEMFGLHERLIRTAMKGTFPISGRDFSVCSTLDHDEETGTLQFVATSVVDPLIPESKKHVRGHLESMGWQLKPHFDSDGKTTSVDVVYIVDIDIKLDTVPSSIRKALSVQIPMNVAKIDELMQKKGFSPYVLNSTTKIIKEELILENDQYDISLIAKDDGVTELKLSMLMYPHGVDVSTIPENCKVELLPNSNEFIRVTLPPRVDLDTLNITIIKYSKGFQMTYNHGQIIPTVSNSPKPEIEKPTDLNDNTKIMTSTNETIEISNESDNVTNNDTSNVVRSSRKYKKLSSVSRNITSKTFVNPSEVSLKSEPYQRMLEKQILLENKIEAVTRASYNGLTPLEVMPKTEESRSSQDLVPLEVKPKTEESRSSHDLAPLEVMPKTEESRPSHDLVPLEVKPKIEVEKPENEVIESNINNINNTVTSNETQNMVIIADPIHFTSQQVGLMFASMLLAYFAGKLSA